MSNKTTSSLPNIYGKEVDLLISDLNLEQVEEVCHSVKTSVFYRTSDGQIFTDKVSVLEYCKNHFQLDMSYIKYKKGKGKDNG